VLTLALGWPTLLRLKSLTVEHLDQRVGQELLELLRVEATHLDGVVVHDGGQYSSPPLVPQSYRLRGNPLARVTASVQSAGALVDVRLWVATREHDQDLTLEFFTDFVVLRLRDIDHDLPAAMRTWVQRFAVPRSAVDADAQLRTEVEILLTELHVRVLENDLLLTQLAERDQLIGQLRGQIATLEEELRRSAIDAGRVRRPVGMIRYLLATALAAFAGTAGPVATQIATQRSTNPSGPVCVVEMAGAHGDTVRSLVARCDHVSQVIRALEGR
jgi:hypothetical protein